MIFGMSAKATTRFTNDGLKVSRLCHSNDWSRWLRFLANKNSQSTTALNHCVDCNYLKQSRRLTKYQLEGGGSQILFVAYQIKERAQAFLHSHSCESLEYQTLLFEIECNCNGYRRDVNIFEGGILGIQNQLHAYKGLILFQLTYLKSESLPF